MPKRILLTGGSGFVGANLARRLMAEGHDVRLVLRPGHQPWRLAHLDRSSFVWADLADAGSVSAAVREIRPDWVFHLAAHGAYPSQTDWNEMLRANVVGTANLVEASLDAGVESFVNTGSSSEYGFKDHAPPEDETIEPNSDYAITKATATLYCGFMARTRGARIRTLRLYSVYGRWEEPTRLIPTLIVNGLRGSLPPLANPRVARDFVYVDDVCDAYLAAAEDAQAGTDAVFNVGTGTQTDLETIVGLARRLLGIDEEPEWGSMPDRSWDTTCWVADNRKIKEQLGWAPRHSLESGLAATIDWLRSDPALLAHYEGVALRTSS